MKVVINGCGIAGPALAWGLKRHGHEPVIHEMAAGPREGGYVVDFWGTGYDVAERMGILPALQRSGYRVSTLRNVTSRGRTASRLDVGVFQSLTQGRYISLPRSALSSRLVEACVAEKVPVHYGSHVVAVEEGPSSVGATFSDGSTQEADLVIGADGLHSGVRGMVFGMEARFERFLGLHVAAVELEGYRPRDELTYVTHTLPGRQISRFSMRGDRTLVLMVFEDRFLPDAELPVKEKVAQAYRDVRWEAPALIEAMQAAGEPYFDRVSQIRMDRWHLGRVALIGDAAGCVSLIAGEGSGLAMGSAHVLAEALAERPRTQALEAWQARCLPWVRRKQEMALKIRGFFAPRNWAGLYLRDAAFRVAALPGMARPLLGRAFGDELELA